MVDYTYSVWKKSEAAWHWELCAMDGRVLTSGLAETHAKGVAYAMRAGLDRLEKHGDAANNCPDAINH